MRYFIVLLLAATAGIAFFLLRDTPSESGSENPDEHGFMHAFNSLQRGVDRRDPIAVEQLIGLLGACESVRKTRDGLTPGRDFERMREYCKPYTAGMQPDNLAGLAAYALPTVLAAEFDKLEQERGRDAVASRLDELVEQGNPHEIRAALDYAAESGIMPSRLQHAVANDPGSQGRLQVRLGALTYVEFCRNGGACGADDIDTLSACLALGPCSNGDRLLDVIRRATPPGDYQAALVLSSRMHGS